MNCKPYSNERSRAIHRRRKTIFSKKQQKRLEEVFQQCTFPGIQTREQLSDELGIREDRIQVWFQNRRSRMRRQSRPSSSEFTESSPSLSSCCYPYDVPRFTYHWDSLPAEPAPRPFRFPSEFNDNIQPLCPPESTIDSCRPANKVYKLTHHYKIDGFAASTFCIVRQQ